jgi:hypothetical protein
VAAIDHHWRRALCVVPFVQHTALTRIASQPPVATVVGLLLLFASISAAKPSVLVATQRDLSSCRLASWSSTQVSFVRS